MSCYCRLNRQIKELHLEDDTVQKIQSLLIDSSSDSPFSSEPEDGLQIDELVASTTSSSDSDTLSKQLSVLPENRKFTLDVIQQIEDPVKQKEYLEKLCQTLQEEAQPSKIAPVLAAPKPNPYNLRKILKTHERSKSANSVGPKTIKIETNLSFDDEQNEEMKSVMISVREIKCQVRENCSRR